MRTKRQRLRVPLAAVAAAGLITVALPAISGLSGVSAGVGTPAGPTGTATTSTTTSTTGTTTPTTGTTTSTTGTATTTTGTATTTTGVHTVTTGSTAAVAPAANAPLSCSSPTIYNVSLVGNFYSLNFETLRNTFASPPDVGGGSLNVNAMGITPDGLTVYTANMTPSGGNTTVHVENVAAGTNADFARQPASNVNTLIAGGFYPINGFYYYGGWNSANTELFLFAFDPSTHTAAAVGTITPPSGVRYTNGDLTFDGAGNMTVLAGSSSNSAQLLTVAAPVPTVGPGGRELPFTVLTTVNSILPENYSGIAFAADSSLYVETVQKELLKINPNTGGVTDLGALTGINGTPTDLASCTFNGSLEVQKNIVGRVAPTDQFRMTITGGGVTSGNTGTTTGSSTGVQTTPGSVAGPIVGIPGTIYHVAETAASGSLSNYSTTWSCLNGSSPFSGGTGTSFNVVFPSPITRSTGASLVCTFTNRPASIAVTKTPSPTSVTAAGQTITYTYAVTNSGPLPLTNVTVADAQTPPAGTLTSGPTCVNLTNPPGACSGSTVPTLAAGQVAHFTATYTVSQADMNQGSVADSATASGNAPSGTQVSATATASVTAAASPSISIVKAAFPNVLTRSGETITYTFLVTNTGNVTLNNVNVTDHPTPPAGALATGPTCQDLSNPAGTCSGNSTTLTPGQRASFIGTYAVTQVDFDHGSVVDSATAAGTPPSGPPVTDLSNTVTVSDIQSPGIKITKTASPTTVTAAGQSVDLHLRGHEQGQRDSNERRRHRRPGGSRWGRQPHLPVPELTGGLVFRPDDHPRPGPNRHVYRDLRRDPGRPRPRLHRRPRHNARDYPLDRPGKRHLQHRHGHRGPIAQALHRQVGQPDHGHRGGPARGLHVLGHQYGERHDDRRRGHRCAGESQPAVSPRHAWS